MSDTGLTVACMTESPNRYDVTVTVARESGYFPDPAEYAVGAEQAAFSRNASVVSAHTAEQIISVVTVQTADRPSRRRRPSRRVRSAKTSGRVTQPLSGRLWPTWCGGS